MCRTLGIRTIAEFVERPETLATLNALGVDYAQGYGVAKPQVADLNDRHAGGAQRRYSRCHFL